MDKLIAIQDSTVFKRKHMAILNLKKINILFLFVISFFAMASAQTKTDSLEALLPGLQDREKAEIFEQLIELNTKSAPGKAIEFGRQALELLEHFEDTKMEINISKKMCSAYMRVGNDSTAIKFGNKSLELAKKVNDRNGQAGALNEIGSVYRKSGEYQEALDYYSRSLKIYEELNDRQNVGSLTMDIGRTYERLGNYTQAMAHYQKSLKIFEEINDKEGVALILIRTGYVYSLLGKYERALEYGFNSLKINEQIDNKIGIGNSLGNIGSTYRSLGKYDKALDYNLQSLKIKEEFGDKWSIAPILANVGLAYSNLGDYTRALQYYFKALELYQEIGDKHNIKIVLNNIGAIKSDIFNDQKSALKYFFKSLKIAEEIGDKFGIALSFNNLGIVYGKLGEYLKAINYETMALAIGKDIKSKPMKKMCYEALAEIYASKGDFTNALENHKLFKSINDSIFTDESSEKIAEMQVRYDTEKKEKEIELLHSEAKIQALEIDKQKNYRNLAIISSVFILVVVILLFIGYRQKNRSNKLLHSLNDEIKQSYEKIYVQAEDLQVSKDSLQMANQELEAFSYSVSHDLRAPLRAIDGFTCILMEDYVEKLDTEGKRMGSVIRQNTQKMSQLINDLLTFSRLGRTSMSLSEIDMKNLVNSIYHEATIPEDRKRIGFNISDLPGAVGDPTMMRQVWMNLISNAVKFSANRGQAVISVTCKEEENKLIYCIKDNGAGFDMKYKDKLFGVFQRLHSEKEFEGTGVGLALVQRIIQRHGGEVWAEGEVDKGAVFYFSLPKKGN